MRLGQVTRGVLVDTASVVFPAYCHSCGDVADEGEWAPLLCRRCTESFPHWDSLVPVPEPLDRGRALSRFEGPAKDLLVGLKYRGLLRAGWVFGARMAAAPEAQRWLRHAGLVVPVPLHWRRRWARGHNQAMTLARSLAWGSRSMRVCNALRRVRATRAQVGLGRDHRLANVSDAFAVVGRSAGEVAGARIVLLDDVVTTGATAAAAAAALKKGGAREVRLYAAAWAQPPGS